MSQAWRVTLVLAAAVLAVTHGAGFNPAQEEAARSGLEEALAGAVVRAAARMDEIALEPYIAQSQRTVAFVKVTTVKLGSNMTMQRLNTMKLRYSPGVDHLVADQDANFTLPLELVSPYIEGDLTHKVNDVGPTGHFNTTIGQLRFEVQGSASVTTAACSVDIKEVTNVEAGDVDTSVSGASLLNSALAREMSKAVRDGHVQWARGLTSAVLAALRAEANQDCTVLVRARLAKVGSN